jgi:hypothetical protein
MQSAMSSPAGQYDVDHTLQQFRLLAQKAGEEDDVNVQSDICYHFPLSECVGFYPYYRVQSLSTLFAPSETQADGNFFGLYLFPDGIQQGDSSSYSRYNPFGEYFNEGIDQCPLTTTSLYQAACQFLCIRFHEEEFKDEIHKSIATSPVMAIIGPYKVQHDQKRSPFYCHRIAALVVLESSRKDDGVIIEWIHSLNTLEVTDFTEHYSLQGLHDQSKHGAEVGENECISRRRLACLLLAVIQHSFHNNSGPLPIYLQCSLASESFNRFLLIGFDYSKFHLKYSGRNFPLFPAAVAECLPTGLAEKYTRHHSFYFFSQENDKQTMRVLVLKRPLCYTFPATEVIGPEQFPGVNGDEQLRAYAEWRHRLPGWPSPVAGLAANRNIAAAEDDQASTASTLDLISYLQNKLGDDTSSWKCVLPESSTQGYCRNVARLLFDKVRTDDDPQQEAADLKACEAVVQKLGMSTCIELRDNDGGEFGFTGQLPGEVPCSSFYIAVLEAWYGKHYNFHPYELRKVVRVLVWRYQYYSRSSSILTTAGDNQFADIMEVLNASSDKVDKDCYQADPFGSVLEYEQAMILREDRPAVTLAFVVLRDALRTEFAFDDEKIYDISMLEMTRPIAAEQYVSTRSNTTPWKIDFDHGMDKEWWQTTHLYVIGVYNEHDFYSISYQSPCGNDAAAALASVPSNSGVECLDLIPDWGEVMLRMSYDASNQHFCICYQARPKSEQVLWLGSFTYEQLCPAMEIWALCLCKKLPGTFILLEDASVVKLKFRSRGHWSGVIRYQTVELYKVNKYKSEPEIPVTEEYIHRRLKLSSGWLDARQKEASSYKYLPEGSCTNARLPPILSNKPTRIPVSFSFPDQPLDLLPQVSRRIRYPQGNIPGCLPFSLASALYAMGEDLSAIQGKAFKIASRTVYSRLKDLLKSSGTLRSDLVSCVNHVCQGYKLTSVDFTRIESPTATPMILNLRAGNKSCEHTVTIYRGLVFDTRYEFAMVQSKSTFDFCCAPYGFHSFSYALHLKSNDCLQKLQKQKRRRKSSGLTSKQQNKKLTRT